MGESIGAKDIEIRLVDGWNVEEIADLYRAGGWWKDTYEASGLVPLMKGSFAFAVAIDRKTSRLAGMGRVLSDGVSDGYIQDLVVLPAYRHAGIGSQLVTALVAACKARGVGWIGLIAEPGSEQFYETLGFRIMPGHVPMLYLGNP
ncbi:MAG: Acetyltransferase (GNAT) family protein [Methanocella sp. PtaU1.Bin125]|nr:MAG: Acetyltransferase (GNAT) family protein [Methanocella sp. PtaU1.Bin125]